VRECTLFSADIRTIQLVTTASAALGLILTHETRLPKEFPVIGLLLIATDLSPELMPTRPGVLLLDLEITVLASGGALVGMAGDDEQVLKNLVTRLATRLSAGPPSQLISVTSAAGGLGLTTLIALLGLSSTRANRSTLLIENSTQLLRILGASAMIINHELKLSELKKIGVLGEDVLITPALLSDACARFDSVIIGALAAAPGLMNVFRVHLTANTALAVEKSDLVLTGIRTDSTQVLVRKLSYGNLSSKQVGRALQIHDVSEWADDFELSLAADFGDLNKAKRATHHAEKIWLNLVGGQVER
jgi:hypothetical protein